MNRFVDAPSIVECKDDTEIRLRIKETKVTERPVTEYRQSTSMRLLIAQEIQDGLEDVDIEEKELEERGKQVEETIKSQRPGVNMKLNC